MEDLEWVARRKAEAERWMVAWDRIEAAVDPAWDPNAPLPEVTPPAEAGLLPIPRTPPEAVKDPALRALYVKAMERNNLKVKHHTEQRQLAKLRKQFVATLLRYFAGTYSVPPFDDAGLESLLSRHIRDAETRAVLLRAVEERKPKPHT